MEERRSLALVKTESITDDQEMEFPIHLRVSVRGTKTHAAPQRNFW